jgi:hypothetical protein
MLCAYPPHLTLLDFIILTILLLLSLGYFLSHFRGMISDVPCRMTRECNSISLNYMSHTSPHLNTFGLTTAVPFLPGAGGFLFATSFRPRLGLTSIPSQLILEALNRSESEAAPLISTNCSIVLQSGLHSLLLESVVGNVRTCALSEGTPWAGKSNRKQEIVRLNCSWGLSPHRRTVCTGSSGSALISYHRSHPNCLWHLSPNCTISISMYRSRQRNSHKIETDPKQIFKSA